MGQRVNESIADSKWIGPVMAYHKSCNINRNEKESKVVENDEQTGQSNEWS